MSTLPAFITVLFLCFGCCVDSVRSSSLRANTGLSLQSTYKLSDNNTMPVIGLGVYLSEPGNETHEAVTWALQAGYRMIDTASMYDNEEDVGDAVLDHLDENNATKIFVSTKLPPEDHGFEETLDACDESIEQLGLETIDLYLIHSPDGERLVETYDAILYLQKEGLVKSVGVSNFGIPHLEAIATGGRPRPVVNQIEMHPLIYQKRKDLIDYCQKNNILIQAYGSMLAGKEEWLEKPLLKDMAQKYKRSETQILLRWALQHGFQVIPKSVNKERIESNIQVFDFELSGNDMATLDNWSGELEEYWNPVDETEVDLGETDNWPDFSALEVPDEELELEDEDMLEGEEDEEFGEEDEPFEEDEELGEEEWDEFMEGFEWEEGEGEEGHESEEGKEGHDEDEEDDEDNEEEDNEEEEEL